MAHGLPARCGQHANCTYARGAWAGSRRLLHSLALFYLPPLAPPPGHLAPSCQPNPSRPLRRPHRVPVGLLPLEDAHRLQRQLHQRGRLGERLDLDDVTLAWSRGACKLAGRQTGLGRQAAPPPSLARQSIPQQQLQAGRPGSVGARAAAPFPMRAHGNAYAPAMATLLRALRLSSAASKAGSASSRSAWASSAIACAHGRTRVGPKCGGVRGT